MALLINLNHFSNRHSLMGKNYLYEYYTLCLTATFVNFKCKQTNSAVYHTHVNMGGKLPIVHVKKLGQMCFKKALDLQKEAAKSVLRQLSSGNSENLKGYLFLVEHNPVYTVGVRKKHYIEDAEKLKSLQADFFETDRGGLITFHGPGQLVSYPVIYLGHFHSKSIKWYVRELENTIIDTCNNFGLKAYTCENVGVWINDKKIASIGLHASRYVTTHGTAINCNVDLGWFSHIEPCGIPDKEVTSLSKELDRDVTVQETIPLFLKEFQNHFPCEFVYDT